MIACVFLLVAVAAADSNPPLSQWAIQKMKEDHKKAVAAEAGEHLL